MDIDSKGKLLVLGTAIASGMAVFYNAFAVKNADPLAFTTLKNILTALMLVAGVLALGRWREILRLKNSQWRSLASIAIVGGSIPFALYFWGLSLSDPASGSFIYRLMFFASAALAAMFLREKPSVKTIGAVVALIIANLLLLGHGLAFGLGEQLVLVATLLWAGESVLSKQALETISPDVVASARLGLGSLILLGAMAAMGQLGNLSAPAVFAPPALVSAFFLLIFVTTWYRGLARISVSEAAALLSAGGLVTATLNLALFGKAPNAIQAASMLIIAAACALILGASPLQEAGRAISNWKERRPWMLRH